MHKSFLLIIVLILSLLTASASWEQFQNDELNNGKANGTGYFNQRAIKSVNDSLNGMDFQPLVSDVDNNGKKEIVIFSGNYLKLFDNRLNLVNERFVGNLLGQPAIYNIDDDNFKEIIFISNVSNVDYFFAYQYNNSGFNHEFNFTVGNGGIGSGIKCTAIGSTDVCVFMDNSQYVHIVNLTSKTDSSYNTSAYTDTQEKVPAIGDLHNNGSLQAVFWFDESNGNNYGLMVFDLISRNLDFSFNNSGIVDNIVQPSSTSFTLKGHPVLADLNKDNKLEIAVSAFYDDATGGEMFSDWFTHLFVYNSSGSKLFSVCEERSSGNCNDGSGDPSKWEGTNPFVLDSDNNGIKDICFIKDKKINGNFKNMTINCYNYSGNVLLDAEIHGETIRTAITADMNNDGVMDIVTENRMYHKNGSSFYANSLDSNFVIPVDIDGNNGLDLLFSNSPLTQVFIDDFGIVEVNNVSISPLILSSDDSLSCSFAVEGSGNLKANVSWYKDNVLQSTETNIACTNGTVCNAANPIPGTSTAKNEEWKCSVAAFNESFKSYTVNDKIKILGKTSEWAGYCNDENNLCRQSGTSYFSNAGTTSTNSSEGMEFEPLVADINNDGKNEIIIFSNSKLIIFNQSLGLINEKNIGTLVGQPAIYNIDSDNNLEIIFNVNVSSASYLMAYEYNNNFNKQCNTTISNGLSGAGIKCADIGSTKSCFFKDQKNVFYNFNMSSCKQIANLTTNNAEDTKPTVPSLLDYDLDGKMEGLWWFNNDSDNFMGIAVVELETMKFDMGFNEIGFIDDVIDGSSDFRYTAGYENVKGNPVFYQSDNAGGYEILIAWDNERYFHGFSLHTCFRSNLKLFDTDGTLLWKNTPATGCPESNTGTHNCDISTPVIADADKDGYEDVCFIMEGDDICYTNAPDDYFYCLNRFGNNVDGYPKNTSDVKLYGPYPTELDTPLYIADMDNDNELEMVGAGFIWNLNGSILKGNYSSFTKFAPVPVDVDKNGVLELIGSKVNQTSVFRGNVNICSGRIQVQSVDYNNNYVPNTNVFVDDVLKGTTDSLGLFESKESGICKESSLSYKVKCQNNTIICETKSITLDNDGYFKGVPFDCSVCGSESDIKINIDNIKVNKNNNEIKVNITIINIPTTNDVNITFKVQGSDGLISKDESQLFNISSNERFKFITQSIALSGNDFAHVYVDPENKLTEANEKNNYAMIPLFEKEVNAYLNISTGYENIDNKIKDYLKLFVNEKPQNEADVTIAIGLPNKNTIINNKNSLTRTNYGWYFNDIIYYNNKPLGSKPYNGLVGAFSDDYNYIFVVGKDIDGLLAAVKRLISARELFFSNLNKDKVSVIEDTDVLGISVADLLRNPSNFPYYEKRGTIMFANVVERVLKDNNFEIDIKTVKSYNDNTTLRLKNINTDFSNDFKDAVIGNIKPVVLARGLWSNLFEWEDFGKELAFDEDNARDTWLIEITGGPGQDCATCPNYEYEDLTDYYWPALITGVQNYSKQKSLDYVGFSNGCRVALDSLKNWSSNGKINAGYVFDSVTGNYLPADLSSSPVDTFVGVGCPGAFNGSTVFGDVMKEFGQEAIQNFNSIGKSHISLKEVSEEICKASTGEDKWKCIFKRFLSGENLISLHLLNEYFNFINSTGDTQPGNGLSLNKFTIIYGDSAGDISPYNDWVVTGNDAISIGNNIQSNNKILCKVYKDHGGLPDTSKTKNIIKKSINNESLSAFWYRCSS